MIVCSLAEVETYGRRAARGAGMAWGLAEEAGKAARWLAERDLPGVELLLRLLVANDRRPYAGMAPVIDAGRWRSADGALCPICSGAALSDRIDSLVPKTAITIEMLACPLLLTPFLDRSSRREHRSLELSWPGVRAVLTGNGLAIDCDDAAGLVVESVAEATVAIRADDSAKPTHRPRITGVGTSEPIWRALDELGQRTYVPATQESRARGAGAGRTDND